MIPGSSSFSGKGAPSGSQPDRRACMAGSSGFAILPCHSTSILVAFFPSCLELFLFSRVEMRWSMRDLNAWSISIWALKICVWNSLCFSFVLLTALQKRQKGQLSSSYRGPSLWLQPEPDSFMVSSKVDHKVVIDQLSLPGFEGNKGPRQDNDSFEITDAHNELLADFRKLHLRLFYERQV